MKGGYKLEEIKDYIYEAYYSEMGESFGKKVRERIHWILQNVKGNDILDVGCSQGITSILLGREGKNVIGIDTSSSAIEDANKYLLKEEEETQNCVNFIKGNFFLEEFNKTFDCVILGEVLEHISDIDTFFAKASSLTKNDGQIIVTTPFGINDFIDHKRTFYLSEFLRLQEENPVVINEVKFLGKWIGVVFSKDQNLGQKVNINNDLLIRLEEAVQKIEREYVSQINMLQTKLETVQNEQSSESHLKYLEEKAEKVKIQKELYDAYTENENIINKYRKLDRDYEILLTRYNNLKNSKFGRLATKYWNFRKKKRR